jgi:hypothetical protein
MKINGKKIHTTDVLLETVKLDKKFLLSNIQDICLFSMKILKLQI